MHVRAHYRTVPGNAQSLGLGAMKDEAAPEQSESTTCEASVGEELNCRCLGDIGMNSEIGIEPLHQMLAGDLGRIVYLHQHRAGRFASDHRHSYAYIGTATLICPRVIRHCPSDARTLL